MSLLLKEINEVLKIHWKPFEGDNMEKHEKPFESAWYKFKPMVADFLNIDMHDMKSYSSFEDLGVDSLDFVELVMMIEEKYDVELTDRELDSIKTIGGLHVLLRRTIDADRNRSNFRWRKVDITHRDTEHTRCSEVSKARNIGRCRHCGRS
jgi:acyl carrier protein